MDDEALNKAAHKGTFDVAKDYFNTSYKYYRLKIFQQLTTSISLIVKLFFIGGLFIIGLIFASVSGAIYLGDLLNNQALGYLVVAGIFFIFSILAYLMRKSIDVKTIKQMSSKFFD